MACFKLPTSLIREINKAVARFWWGDTEKRIQFIGPNGKICAKPRRREDWALETSALLIRLSLPSNSGGFGNILTHLLRKPLKPDFSKDDWDVWAVLMWMIWRQRCDSKHGNPVDGRSVGFIQASNLVHAFKEARLLPPFNSKVDLQIGDDKWSPTEVGCYRVDVDACVNEQLGIFGIGAAIRDHQGKLLIAAAKPICRPISTLEAEVLAATYGLGIALRKDAFPATLCSDSIKAVYELLRDDGSSDIVIEEAKALIYLLRKDELIKFQHMRRNSNKLAHSIAQFGARCKELTMWDCNFPPWMLNLCTKDLN